MTVRRSLPLPFQVFQSAKNLQTDIYLEGFTLRYTGIVPFSTSVIYLFPPARPSMPGALSNHSRAFDFSFSYPRCLIESFFKLRRRDKIRESSQFGLIHYNRRDVEAVNEIVFVRVSLGITPMLSWRMNAILVCAREVNRRKWKHLFYNIFPLKSNLKYLRYINVWWEKRIFLYEHVK